MKLDKLPQKIDLAKIPKQHRPYFEAREKGELAKYYLDRFIVFRDNYRDDLPQEDVRKLVTLDEKGMFVGDNYKCRGNYIFGLSMTLQGAVADGAITDPELIMKIKEFHD